MASILQIIFTLMSVALASAAIASARANEPEMCLEARMPIINKMYGSVHHRHPSKTQTCQECCKQHGKMFDYRYENGNPVCSCISMNTNLETRISKKHLL